MLSDPTGVGGNNKWTDIAIVARSATKTQVQMFEKFFKFSPKRVLPDPSPQEHSQEHMNTHFSRSTDMFAIMGSSLYGDTDQEHFGTLRESFFTCFVLLTLDDWLHIYYSVTEIDPGEETSSACTCMRVWDQSFIYLYHIWCQLCVLSTISYFSAKGHVIVFLIIYIILEYLIFFK